jgi:hypothetical protein
VIIIGMAIETTISMDSEEDIEEEEDTEVEAEVVTLEEETMDTTITIETIMATMVTITTEDNMKMSVTYHPTHIHTEIQQLTTTI